VIGFAKNVALRREGNGYKRMCLGNVTCITIKNNVESAPSFVSRIYNSGVIYFSTTTEAR